MLKKKSKNQLFHPLQSSKQIIPITLIKHFQYGGIQTDVERVGSQRCLKPIFYREIQEQ